MGEFSEHILFRNASINDKNEKEVHNRSKFVLNLRLLTNVESEIVNSRGGEIDQKGGTLYKIKQGAMSFSRLF